LDIVKDDSFYEESSIFWRVFYMTPVFFNFRMRLYSGFVLSECTCISAGLGVYPEACEPKPGMGPSKLHVLKEWIMKSQEDDDNEPIGEAKALGLNFEAIHNIDEYATETVTTMREALKTWNMTVQFWLASNVYRRLPGLSRGLRSVAVMIVSSAWHGVYPGYYLSLGSVPFVLAVEDIYEKILRRRLCQMRTDTSNSSGTQRSIKLYDLVAWFARFQWFSYLGMGFQLLSIELTMKFWHSIYYIGHTIFALFLLSWIGIIYHGPGRVPPESDGSDGSKLPEEIVKVFDAVGSFSERPFTSKDSWCSPCDTWKPALVHHCSTCKRCGLWVDHHCSFSGQCVGFRNMRCYVLWLVYTQVLLVFLAAIVLLRMVSPGELVNWGGCRLILFAIFLYIGWGQSRGNWLEIKEQLGVGWHSGVLYMKFLGLANHANSLKDMLRSQNQKVANGAASLLEQALIPLVSGTSQTELLGIFLAQDLEDAFTQVFGEPPSILWLVPLRPGGDGDPLEPRLFSYEMCQAWYNLAETVAICGNPHALMYRLQQVANYRQLYGLNNM